MKGYAYASGGLTFFVPCVPPKATHQAKKIALRGSRRGHHGENIPTFGIQDKPELENARGLLTALFRPFAPPRPIGGAVSLVIEFTWPWLKGATKKERAFGSAACTSKPDGSNAFKTAEDVLVALRFLEDDAAVAESVARKWYGDRPGIGIRIARLERAVPIGGYLIAPPGQKGA